MAIFEAQTPEYPRESLRARLINYAPSILIVAAMAVVPGPLAYFYCKAASNYVGIWGYFPLALITTILCIYSPFLYWTCSSNLHSLKYVAAFNCLIPLTCANRPADTITKICRAACILFHVGLFSVFCNNIILAVALASNPLKSEAFPRAKSLICTFATLGTLLVIYWVYHYCRTNYYEQVIMRANAQRYVAALRKCN
jgi:hypothetical protein